MLHNYQMLVERNKSSKRKVLSETEKEGIPYELASYLTLLANVEGDQSCSVGIRTPLQ